MTEPRGPVGHARAAHVMPDLSRGVFTRPAHAVAAALVVDVWERGRNMAWRALRAGEGTAERWHGVCVPGLGADILSPAPRQRQCAAGWLECQNRVPVCGMRL